MSTARKDSRLSAYRSLLLAAAVLILPFAAHAQVDVNSASASELESLPGIGPATAQSIIEDREANGPFSSLSDLTRVRGIGDRTVEKLEGLAVAGTGAAAPPTETRQEARGVSPAEIARVMERYHDEPSVQAVQERAMRYAEIHPELIEAWRSRSSYAAILPQLRATYRRNLEEDTRLIEQPGSADRWQRDWDDDNQVTTVARWDLDELIFNTNELRVSSEAVRLVRLREGVLNQVTKLYFERRRLQIERDLSSTMDVAAAVRREMRLHELTAQIDALTGGWFSEQLTEGSR
ncbi:MAG: ComEA family DNA-binding protein [Myxococcota bacterium]